MKTPTPNPLLVALALKFLASTISATAAEVPRPNFIVIMAEAQGWASASVQMDDAVPASRDSFSRTPNLEKLAAGGMRFANFYAASPRCTPTRAALFTGKSPAALHMTFIGEGKREETAAAGRKVVTPGGGTEMPEAETTIAELLKREGYATAHFGKWHAGRANPQAHGFDENDGANSNGGPENVENPNPKQAFGITERGIDFMARQAKAGKPFYLQVSHYPGRGGTDARPETYAAVRKRATAERDQRLIDAEVVREDMDATIGMLLAQVESLGIASRTYVIYTADHGAQGGNANAPLANGKGSVWEGGIRVPLIMSGPGIKAGACTHVRASTVDILPTMAALAHVKALPVGLEGGNLAPVFNGEAAATVKRARGELVVHFPHYDKDRMGPASAIMLGDFKLIRVYETGERKLFDLANDISERNDLAKQMPAKVAELDQRLTDYLKAVNAQMPSINPNADPSQAADTLPGEKKGGRMGGKGGGKGGKGGSGGELPAQPAPPSPNNQ